MNYDVQSIAKKYLKKIRKSGPTNIMAVCPFHTKTGGAPERTPSFTMSLTKGVFFCFSCKSSGNLRTFLEQVGEPEYVVRKLYGELLDELDKTRDPPKDAKRTEFKGYGGVLEESVLGLFDMCPLDLINDGFSEDTLQYFDVGFDEKNLRITYPLRALTGELIGISGRTVLNDGSAKYKVYAHDEYKAWNIDPVRTDKDVVVWNAHRVVPRLVKIFRPTWYLVEGFKAAMWLHQHGYTDVVALAGSYMGAVQQQVLERLGGQVVLMLDNDNAGLKGTALTGDRLSNSADVFVALYDQHQPTDVGSLELQEALVRPIGYTTWKMLRQNDLAKFEKKKEIG